MRTGVSVSHGPARSRHGQGRRITGPLAGEHAGIGDEAVLPLTSEAQQVDEELDRAFCSKADVWAGLLSEEFTILRSNTL